MQTLFQDVRFGARVLLRSPGMTLAVMGWTPSAENLTNFWKVLVLPCWKLAKTTPLSRIVTVVLASAVP